VKKIRSDNGSEFKNLQVEEYLEEEGIKHEFSAPYTPHQNGVVERKNMTLIDMVKRPDPLGLKCDTITSPRRLVITFITSNSYRV
jgi:transposase InsO family protein